MPILQHHINELKEIYRKQTGEDLSDMEAWDMAVRLMNLFRLLLEDEHEPLNHDDLGLPQKVSH
jgi:hypothetical protein